MRRAVGIAGLLFALAVTMGACGGAGGAGDGAGNGGQTPAPGSGSSPPETALRDRYAAAAHSRLSEEAWELVRAEGRTMTLEEAVAYALEEDADA